MWYHGFYFRSNLIFTPATDRKNIGFNLHKLALVFTCTDILITALKSLPTVFYNNQYFKNTLMNVLNTCNNQRVFFLNSKIRKIGCFCLEKQHHSCFCKKCRYFYSACERYEMMVKLYFS